ncbi:GntR family transcriptional regulator [Kiritimatiellota bacterium B12222]|nr:GntR family transcriptional regulator [Kiritimatiellota bacterium B12222]
MKGSPKSEGANSLKSAHKALQANPLWKSPLHVQIRETLRQLIKDQFKPGDKFFSEPELIKQLGVSQGTVRRALTDLSHEGILIRRVPQGTFIAENPTEGYTLGVFMPQYDSPFLMDLLEYISKGCRNQSVPIKIHKTYRGEELNSALSGINPITTHERILLLGETPETAIELHRTLSNRGYRVINVDTLLEGCGDGYVGVDNVAGIEMGLNYLVDLGHKRITLLVNETMESGNIRERVAAFENFCKEHNLPESKVVDCGTDFWTDSSETASSHMSEVMSATAPPTAIMTVSAPGAWGVLQWLQENHVAVPEKVSLLSFDDATTNRFLHPTLTSIAQPIEEMAQRILELIFADEMPEQATHLLTPYLVIRKSCSKMTQ